jgi:hypothetical protein
MRGYCDHLDKFKRLQKHYLQNEFNFDELILKQKNSTENPREHYSKNYLNSWTKGIGDAYCILICTKQSCDGKNVKLGNLKKEILKYQIGLKEKQREISFEEAWEQYIYKLGPSFWKGVTDVVSSVFLNHLKNIPSEFLSNLDEI